MKPWTKELEQASLDLVADLQDELSRVLKSLDGEPHEGLPTPYVVYSAGQINRAAEGFVFLRKAGRVDSCKLLVRPAIELMMRLLAIRKNPETLYQIAFGEIMIDDVVFFRASSKKSGVLFDEAAYRAKWDVFRKAYAAKFPTHKLIEQKLRLIEVASRANLTDYYNVHYRLYCQITHSAFRALMGEWNEATDRSDNGAMALCVSSALESLSAIGETVTNLDALHTRLKQIADT